MGRLGNSEASGVWEKVLFLEKIENLLEPRRIRKIRRLRSVGDPEDSGDRRIGENHDMWQNEESLSRRTRGKPTKWKIGGFGDLED